MTMTERKVIKAKVGLLELAKQLGSVTQACRVMGYSRDSFYRFSRRCRSRSFCASSASRSPAAASRSATAPSRSLSTANSAARKIAGSSGSAAMSSAAAMPNRCPARRVAPSRKCYPATCGRAVQAGIRQSIPSSSIASCAGVSDTAPSLVFGHTKRPRSSCLA